MTTSAPPQSEETPSGQTEVAASDALKVGTSNVRELFTRNLRQSGIYIAFVVIVALFAILTDGLSLNPTNVTNIILQYSYVLILAIGMVIVIIAGHIDLSVGSVVALTGAVSAVLVIKDGWPGGAGILGALVTRGLIGCWQGVWGALLGLPALLLTPARLLRFPR